MEISYNELRQKEIVNVLCGKRMGKLSDLIFSTNSKKVLGIVVPSQHKLFRQREDIFIPWDNINKIGDDVILVSINVDSCTAIVKSSGKDTNQCSIASDDYIG
ncbi:MAG: YlmC/YmxH family sporulation protein [Clostridia bacterium]|nr:YlmC/YmxH family sporulation protein [Clostridia bacterium]